MKKRLHFAVVAVCLAGTALSAGQQAPPPQQPQQPTFRVQVDYVEVDVVVTDQRGNLVRDLKKEDFQVFEDGKAQTVTAFTHVDIPIERGDRPLFADAPIEPDVRTNERPFEGRVYVMVIDDLHTRFGRTQRVKSAARQFIERRMGANDLMAIVHTFGATDASQEFTSNKRLLLAAVDKTQGRKLDSMTANKTREYYNTLGTRQTGDALNDPDDQERSYNATNSLRTLQNVAEWFGSVRGRRKTILFVSEGIDYDLNELIAQNGSTHRDATKIIDETREVIQAATRSNVSIYGIDPRGLTDLGDESIEIGSFPDDTSLGIGQGSLMNELRTAQDSLRVLSEETGGFAVVNRNDFTTAYDRIVEDNSSYYVLAYYPPDTRPGRLHKIDVRVTRPGLTVRARKGYLTPKKPAVEKTSAKDTRTPEIRAALDSPLPVSGLTMHVFAAPFKGTAPNASVLLGVELRGRDLQLAANDQIQLSYMAIDAKGKVQGGNTDMVSMTNLRPETKARIESSGLRLLNRIEIPPGRYQLRVAAHDSAGGNVGSLQYDLDVPDFAKAPFGMSGVALTSMSSAQLPTAHPDEATRGVLPGPAAAGRSFPQNDEVALFAEVYDNDAKTPHKVDITTTVTTDEGKVMFKTDESRDTADFQGKTGGFGYTTRIPMKDLAPGLYVLTVSARSRLGNQNAIERQVRFSVTPPPAR
ncbi:MAG TPA: VWA domain-containing protein [Vicinamibacterales bacterium]|nr:VWA domain-containing protein [Vicinamibacterales bacterium]